MNLNMNVRLDLKTIAKRTILIAFLTLGFVLCSGKTAMAAQNYSGNLDSITGNTFSGWARNSSDPSETAAVRIVVTSQKTGQTVAELSVGASEYREDLETVGYENGCYGFSAALSWDQLEDGVYTATAYVAGFQLGGSLSFTKGNLNKTLLGVFKTTGYCPCNSCSEGWGRHTSTGAIASSGHTIAVDPNVIPYGSQVMIGDVIYTAEDRGGGVRGNHIDIFFDTHAETRQHGTQQQEVYLLNS